MYSLYIPKYQDDEFSWTLLAETLGDFMYIIRQNDVKLKKSKEREAPYTYGLLVAPGFMSTEKPTIETFLVELARRVDSDMKLEVGVGLFYGNNGRRNVKGTSLTILETHNDLLTTTHGLTRIRLRAKKVYDHRKMVFVFQSKKWDFATEELNKGNVDKFIKDVTVKAVLIGSSNFSYNTYFNSGKKPDKGEADLLMFTDAYYMHWMKDRIKTSDPPRASRMVLYRSIAGGKKPKQFFRDILKDFLDHSLD